MTTEEHKTRHAELHEALDELIAEWTSITRGLPSRASILDLVKWSCIQTENPTDAGTVAPSGTWMADHLVIDAMLRWGGGFVRALADAAQRADPDNLRRIKQAWPEYWQRYSDMAHARPDAQDQKGAA